MDVLCENGQGVLKHAPTRWVGYVPVIKKDVTYEITSRDREATSGFEPLVQLLQSRALPLGDVAGKINE